MAAPTAMVATEHTFARRARRAATAYGNREGTRGGDGGNSTQADVGGATAVDGDVQLMKPDGRLWNCSFAFTPADIVSWSR